MENPQQDGRTARKHRAIVDAARTLFLRNGYAGTSMDEIAAMAEVSKQTVYKHFADKQRLFTELITLDISQIEVEVHPLEAAMPGTDDLERDLREYARMHLAVVMQPHLLRMRRVLIGEADRFPDLARAWYENGPVRSSALFAGWFEALGRRGLLDVPDPLLAAQHFNWLVLSIPLNRAMSLPVEAALYDEKELNHYADEGVRVFLAAYGR
ncbi:TetR/AcrR family transcriptional regulator [Nonomuraea endophytica]|uniref:AcrR family transcriptional regulator n=1 Tax=Nonomuraea endophytica TaxID=714136 RepID=A0A7W8AFQ2_9ACTN|nr:TetR/AcrR family transcriptional regulator [Nonomuraea endophytica]MBB5084859.1 AcrR family transcriptional regulator [Nonomuraea endophytica]